MSRPLTEFEDRRLDQLASEVDRLEDTLYERRHLLSTEERLMKKEELDAATDALCVFLGKMVNKK